MAWQQRLSADDLCANMIIMLSMITTIVYYSIIIATRLLYTGHNNMFTCHELVYRTINIIQICSKEC